MGLLYFNAVLGQIFKTSAQNILKVGQKNLSRNLFKFWPFNFGDLSQIWPTSECQKEWYKDISRQ